MTHRWLLPLGLVLTSHLAIQAQNPYVDTRRHWNKERGYAPFRHATPECIEIDNTTPLPLSDSQYLANAVNSCSLRFTAANSHNHPAKAYPYTNSEGNRKKVKCPAWEFFVKGIGNDSLTFNVRTIEQTDAFSSEAAIEVTARHGDTVIKSVTITEGVDCHTGKNNWLLTMKDGAVTLSCGNRSLQPVMSFTSDFPTISEFGFTALPGASISVNDITFSDTSPERNLTKTQWSNPDHLRNYLAASKDPIEGYWTFFDRTLEESLLMLGGDYQLAMVKDDSGYLLIYLGGARVNATLWQPGMVKARLSADAFPGIYDVTWIDAEGLPMTKDIKAQVGEGETLTIQFPYQSSTLRLRRIPQ